MAKTAPLSEFNRNQTKLIQELQESGEPLYLTRNGRTTLVVMDADAYDREREMREGLRRREEATLHALMRGYQDVIDGNASSLSDADARIRKAKGW
jgi:prevent-host-death family protein